jgi:transcriptional regulator of stress and heat shock response
MKNLADAIEEFIIRELLQDSEDSLLVQRNELAERLSCAPSQISYVLSTRFTPERGYMVESRRGSGGFVRIVRVVPQQEKPKRELEAAELVQHLAAQRLITQRERKLLEYMLEIIDASEQKKKKVLQQAMMRLNGSGQG